MRFADSIILCFQFNICAFRKSHPTPPANEELEGLKGKRLFQVVSSVDHESLRIISPHISLKLLVIIICPFQPNAVRTSAPAPSTSRAWLVIVIYYYLRLIDAISINIIILSARNRCPSNTKSKRYQYAKIFSVVLSNVHVVFLICDFDLSTIVQSFHIHYFSSATPLSRTTRSRRFRRWRASTSRRSTTIGGDFGALDFDSSFIPFKLFSCIWWCYCHVS